MIKDKSQKGSNMKSTAYELDDLAYGVIRTPIAIENHIRQK